MIPKDYIAELRAHSTILRWVTTPIMAVTRPHGIELITQSPFSNQTASLKLNVEKQTYHCLATGATGDLFDFVMRCRHLSFIDAVHLIAKESFFPTPPKASGFTIRPIWDKLNPSGHFVDSRLRKGQDAQKEPQCAF